jgi:hypothetical protein
MENVLDIAVTAYNSIFYPMIVSTTCRLCCSIHINFHSRDSSVSKVTGYELDDWGSIPSRGMDFFFHLILIGSVVNPSFYSTDIGDKVAGA